MKRLLSYLLSPIHYLFFGLALVVFDPIQRVALRLGGYWPHKVSVDILNFFLTKSLYLLLVRPTWIQPHALPTDRPLIVVANHQSLYDIPPFFWYLRRHHVKFIAKKELARGVPSISYNLRHGGSAVIDRKDSRQALPAIKQFAQYIEQNNYAAVIFPEGTRSRTGVPKSFAPGGLTTLLKYAPSALVVPVSINHSWEIVRYGKFPLGVLLRPTWQVHAPIEPQGSSAEEVMQQVERTVVGAIALKKSE